MKNEEFLKKEFVGGKTDNPMASALQGNSSSFIPHPSFVYFLGLGTNLGNKEQNLRDAVQKIEERIGRVSSLSAFYTTAPWGFDSANCFLNAVCQVGTTLQPLQVLEATQAVEREMGRTSKSVNGVYHDRVIDIDLLLCYAADGTPVTVDTPHLHLPHPLMHLRDFVMRPLVEIAPHALHPIFRKTMEELWEQESCEKYHAR